jgi:hypothetical protein
LKAAAAEPMAGTNADVLSASTEVAQVPAPPSITNLEIDAFPFVAGFDHETVNPPSAGTTETFCGWLGTVKVIAAVALFGETINAARRRDDANSAISFEFVFCQFILKK